MPTNSKENKSKKATKKSTDIVKKVATKKANSTAKKSTTTSRKTSNKKAASTVKKAPKKKVITKLVEYYDLPTKYDLTVVKVLFQTPKKLFVYWEISDADKETLIKTNGKDFFERTTPYLVVNNNTKNYSFEIEINDYANSWYFDVPDSDCQYSVELIRKNKQTEEITPIQDSNNLEVPNNHILFEQNRREIFFQNVKTHTITSKSIANLQFINHMGICRPVTLSQFYNKFYDEKDLYSANNPSSY